MYLCGFPQQRSVGRAKVAHAVVVIFMEFFAWGLLTTPMLTVSHFTAKICCNSSLNRDRISPAVCRKDRGTYDKHQSIHSSVYLHLSLSYKRHFQFLFCPLWSESVSGLIIKHSRSRSVQEIAVCFPALFSDVFFIAGPASNIPTAHVSHERPHSGRQGEQFYRCVSFACDCSDNV